MSLPSGTSDPRRFRHFAKVADDGSVAAIVEVVDGSVPFADAVYVEVTDLYPYDLRTARVKPADVQAAKRLEPEAFVTLKADLTRLNTIAPKDVARGG